MTTDDALTVDDGKRLITIPFNTIKEVKESKVLLTRYYRNPSEAAYLLTIRLTNNKIYYCLVGCQATAYLFSNKTEIKAFKTLIKNNHKKAP